MKITDGAKQLLEDFLTKKGVESIRLTTKEGCCGPEFTITLGKPQETDTIETINGIKVALDSQITSTEELTIDNEEKRIVLIGASSCC
jgi:iron-sulfur cluster assembly protein